MESMINRFLANPAHRAQIARRLGMIPAIETSALVLTEDTTD